MDINSSNAPSANNSKKLLMIFLAIIILLVLGYLFLIKTSQAPIAPAMAPDNSTASEQGPTPAEKAQILQELSQNSSSSEQLSASDKQQIANQLSQPSSSDTSTPTPTERQQVLDQLH